MSGQTQRPRPRTGYPRRKAVTACQVCRERKKRCDNSRPSCSFCQRIGVRCEYSPLDEGSFDAASLAILDRLSVIESVMRQLQQTSQVVETTVSPSTIQPISEAVRPAIQVNEIHDTEDSSSFVWSTGTGAHSSVRADKVLQWPALENALSSLPRYPLLNCNKDQHYTHLNDAISRSRGHPHEASGSLSWSISTEKAQIEAMVDQFFSRVHVKNPILDRDTVRRYCLEYYENGPLFNLRACLVLLVCALGCIAPEFKPPDALVETADDPSQWPVMEEALAKGNCYFVAAEKRLGAAITESSSLAVQCLCLAGVYHMYTINPVAAQAMFHAAGYTLQRLISTGSDCLEGASQVDSSLFWTCSKSEREILTELPIAQPTLSSPGQSSGYPLPPKELFGISETDTWPQSEHDSWYFFLSEFALRRILERVSEAVGNFFEDISHALQPSAIEEFGPIALEFERQVHAWREHLPPPIKFPDSPHPVNTEWQQYSRGPYYRVLEIMFRPFVFASIHQTNPDDMVRRLANKGLQYAFNYLSGARPWHRHHGRWLQLRHELTATALLLSASKSGVKMPLGWYNCVQGTTYSLEYWKREAPFCQSYIDVISALNAHFQPADAEMSGYTGERLGDRM